MVVELPFLMYVIWIDKVTSLYVLSVVTEVTEEKPEETVTVVTPKPKEEAPEKETLEVTFAPEESPKPETVEITFAPTEEAPTEVTTVEVTKAVKEEGTRFGMNCYPCMGREPHRNIIPDSYNRMFPHGRR